MTQKPKPLAGFQTQERTDRLNGPDLLLADHGSIFILTAGTEDGQEWMDQHLPDDAQRWCGNGVVVEHRYIADIVNGASNDGLHVQ